MHQPDPERSCKISDDFDDLAASMLPPDSVERLKNVGPLLFTKESIYTTADQLSQIFRKVCVDNHITEAYFNEKYSQYAINRLGKFPQAAANNRSNTLKMIKHGDRLSWRKFLELTTLVLELKIDDLTVAIHDVRNDQIKIYSSKKDTNDSE